LNKNLGEEYWLALARAPYLGPVNFVRLLNHFGNPRNVFEAGWGEWQALNIRGSLLNYLRHPNWSAVENDLHWLAQKNHYLLTLFHPDYPPLLREIYDPPPLLFVSGNCAILRGVQLAIVGTRHPSREGTKTAGEFAKNLAQQGFTITGGMALGIEGASHWGALAGGGKNIAVAGRGLEQIYPTQHRYLADIIVQRGALVSEFPPDTPVRRDNFPRRNRIVSGLSLGTLLIEAPERSSALQMVHCALEQGREVFVVPGSIHNPLVKGCHRLIKEGAQLVENANDILEGLL